MLQSTMGTRRARWWWDSHKMKQKKNMSHIIQKRYYGCCWCNCTAFDYCAVMHSDMCIHDVSAIWLFLFSLCRWLYWLSIYFYWQSHVLLFNVILCWITMYKSTLLLLKKQNNVIHSIIFSFLLPVYECPSQS